MYVRMNIYELGRCSRSIAVPNFVILYMYMSLSTASRRLCSLAQFEELGVIDGVGCIPSSRSAMSRRARVAVWFPLRIVRACAHHPQFPRNQRVVAWPRPSHVTGLPRAAVWGGRP